MRFKISGISSRVDVSKGRSVFKSSVRPSNKSVVCHVTAQRLVHGYGRFENV
jgi:hypothetical protein